MVKARPPGVYFSAGVSGAGCGYTLPLCRVARGCERAGRVHDISFSPSYPQNNFVYETRIRLRRFSSTKWFVYEYSSTKGWWFTIKRFVKIMDWIADLLITVFGVIACAVLFVVCLAVSMLPVLIPCATVAFVVIKVLG